MVYVKHAVEVAEAVALFNLSTSSTELVERCMISLGEFQGSWSLDLGLFTIPQSAEYATSCSQHLIQLL